MRFAAAYDPFDAEARDAIGVLADRLSTGFSPHADVLGLGGSYAVLADGREISSNPALVTRFTDAFTAADNAKLVIHAPGMSAADVGQALAESFAAAGVNPDEEADMVAVPDEHDELDRAELQLVTDTDLRTKTSPELRELYQTTTAMLRPPQAASNQLDGDLLAA
jgi:hypothetical protein